MSCIASCTRTSWSNHEKSVLAASRQKSRGADEHLQKILANSTLPPLFALAPPVTRLAAGRVDHKDENSETSSWRGRRYPWCPSALVPWRPARSHQKDSTPHKSTKGSDQADHRTANQGMGEMSGPSHDKCLLSISMHVVLSYAYEIQQSDTQQRGSQSVYADRLSTTCFFACRLSNSTRRLCYDVRVKKPWQRSQLSICGGAVKFCLAHFPNRSRTAREHPDRLPLSHICS